MTRWIHNIFFWIPTRRTLFLNLWDFIAQQICIEKENNFKQPGERYRSWAPDRYLTLDGLYTILKIDFWNKNGGFAILIISFSGKRGLSVDGWMLYLILVSPTRSAVSGFHTGHRYNICSYLKVYFLRITLVVKKCKFSYLPYIDYFMVQADKSLGQKLASRLNVRPTMWSWWRCGMLWVGEGRERCEDGLEFGNWKKKKASLVVELWFSLCSDICDGIDFVVWLTTTIF